MSLAGRGLLTRHRNISSSSSQHIAPPSNAPLLFLYPRWVRTISIASVEGGKTVEDEGPRETGIIQSDGNLNLHSSSFQQGNLARRIDWAKRRIQRHKNKAHTWRYNWLYKVSSARHSTPKIDKQFDWRLLLRGLDNLTPQRSKTWHENALTVLIPPNAISSLVADLDTSIWEINRRTGCHLRLWTDLIDGKQYAAVSISGPVSQVVKASSGILQATGAGLSEFDALAQTLSRHPHQASTDNLPVQVPEPRRNMIVYYIRPTLSDHRKPWAPQRADAVSLPKTWTQASFAEYVLQVTHIEMKSLDHSRLYGPGETHQEVVLKILRELFTNDACAKAGVITTQAFNYALGWMAQHSQIKDARLLVTEMETRGLKMNAESYNIMLKASLKYKYSRHYYFSWILNLMSRQGIQPDAGTWIVYIMALEDPDIKLQIVSKMRQKGLLHHPGIKVRVCEELIEEQLRKAIEKRVPFNEFLDQVQDQYGPKWISTISAHRMINILSLNGMFQETLQVFDLMRENGTPGIERAVNTALYRCSLLRRASSALEILHHVSTSTNFEPDSRTYHILFGMAYELRLLTLSRTIWRYACLSQNTDFRTRRRLSDSFYEVMKSLDKPVEDSSVRLLFKLRLAPFVLGAAAKFPTLLSHPRSPLHKFPNLDRLLIGSGEALRLPPSEGTPRISSSSPPASESWQHEVRTWLMALDLMMFRNWNPVEPLSVALLEAIKVDQAWKSSGAFHTNYAMEWLEEHAPVQWVKSKSDHHLVSPWQSAIEHDIKTHGFRRLEQVYRIKEMLTKHLQESTSVS